MISFLLSFLVLTSCTLSVLGFLPFQNPSWESTWDISQSTLTMAINSSGPYDLNRAKQFGIVSYDWSSQKAQWVLTRPMNCEELMLEQATVNKLANPDGHVFVYRNLVKALPWFTSVRKIIDDPAYSGFFLNFAVNSSQTHVPVCTIQNSNYKCSPFYHDQEQTPQVPNATVPYPDGSCDVECDCGSVPCGEYLFDHRNGSMLTEWLLNEYILGYTGMGSLYVDGLFIDDFWCSNIINGTGNCTDPVQGPSEINRYSQYDMGLSDDDIIDITIGWLENMERVQQAIVDVGGYTWSLMPDQSNANAMPVLINSQSDCIAYLNTSCQGNNPYMNAPLLSGLLWNGTTSEFPYLSQQVASFLLMRGPYAYLGYGEWGMTWPGDVPLPGLVWNQDYGMPVDDYCYRPVPGVNIFERRYSKANVQMDCDDFVATITMT